MGNDSARPFYFAVQQLSVLSNVELRTIAPHNRPRSCLVAREERRILAPFPEAERVQWLGNLWPKLLRRRSRVRSSKSVDLAPIPARSKCSPMCRSNCRARRALVVVLHGCGQTAAAYDFGTGWSTLAKRYGFALLMPEQQGANNANTCFNWFNPGDVARGRGEAASIRQMVARMVADHKIDPRRIYVTGLSAGGAMTSVMLATYPEVFAGGAIIAGLPYRHRQQCPRSARRHDAVDVAPRRQIGRSGPQGLQAQGPVAESVGVARQRRPHREPRQRQRNRQAMARRSRPAGSADVGRRCRRPSARGLVECRRRDRRRVLHHHRHGPWHAAGPGRQ